MLCRNSVASKARSGRSKLTTLSEEKYIKLSFLRDRKATSTQIQNLLNKEHKTPISKVTVKESCHVVVSEDKLQSLHNFSGGETRPKAWVS